VQVGPILLPALTDIYVDFEAWADVGSPMENLYEGWGMGFSQSVDDDGHYSHEAHYYNDLQSWTLLTSNPYFIGDEPE